MQTTFVDETLAALAVLIRDDRWKELQTDTLEIKPLPPSGGEWRERYESIGAFLNTRGGVLLLGVREVGQGQERRYVLTGWQPNIEAKLAIRSTRPSAKTTCCSARVVSPAKKIDGNRPRCDHER